MSAERLTEVIARLLAISGAPEQASGLFQAALTHRSWVNENADQASSEELLANERLEFLGDAVLGLTIARRLYERLPGVDEGFLSKAKAHLVSAEVLARHARSLDLGSALRLGRGEERSGGRERDSLQANALEAVLGALFLTAGLDAVARLVLSLWDADLELEAADPGVSDSKSLLQELSQKLKGVLPVYQVERLQGPDHDRRYEISVHIHGREYGRGLGKSKKEAEQAAALDALAKLRADEVK
jgi:ribonuclease III